jgi:hypothetical protein
LEMKRQPLNEYSMPQLFFLPNLFGMALISLFFLSLFVCSGR